MEIKETDSKTNGQQTLLHNDEFFKYIFKKTEKIVCAVFYTIRGSESMRHDDVLVRDLEDVSSRLMDTLFTTLRAGGGTRELRLEDVSHALLVLESKLRIACAAHILGADLLAVFEHEIASVMRTLKTFLNTRTTYPFGVSEVARTADKTRARTVLERSRVMPTEGGVSQPTLSRRDRILNVLKDKVAATIKDISESVTDCSEKTIQRELIDLIKDGVIVREGERRWSKYKLV